MMAWIFLFKRMNSISCLFFKYPFLRCKSLVPYLAGASSCRGSRFGKASERCKTSHEEWRLPLPERTRLQFRWTVPAHWFGYFLLVSLLSRFNLLEHILYGISRSTFSNPGLYRCSNGWKKLLGKFGFQMIKEFARKNEPTNSYFSLYILNKQPHDASEC